LDRAAFYLDLYSDNQQDMTNAQRPDPNNHFGPGRKLTIYQFSAMVG
jgi:hypothetical protein